ncbi:MAG: sigma 54-interacting transcriptional regulator [Sandaracinaceae bacterium]|nr:sigma 54-interacting transcriptional regulator [Sandaracinaceae bacterium]MBP7685774.1 sigma 54-interacting transcriptional regulator [Deltaproteobacteria bacterium]MBK7150458.1 sigma 54-interacting transcriptional regulator [Sandaracinaceae bacterium]MBK7777714.1 sigma 54-interacting transcriptional regulator [Sandaracinaceae bacterium]MBK8408702.1 sigma 54-interacting transcriptional regulator [Sandaracinaceae bacterium]
MRPLLRTVLENRSLRLDVQRRFAIVGESPPVLAMVARIAKVAPIPRPVLVLGERGTGKELVAKALHDASGRSGPFVAVNCACFTDELLEAELFGHERGAFTGAHKPSLGKFELANQGTLFLDEIGHMSLPFQRKILRAVEYGTFLRVGGQAERSVSVRVVAATNADLRARMGDGTFLPDLYDRLAFEVIHVPPLRERPGDIDVLARHFFERFMSEVPAFHGKVLTEDGLEALRHYAFPGNVRELRTVIERAVYRDTTHALTAEDIGELGPPRSTTAGSFRQRVEELERALIHEAMTAAHGNGAEAARALGLAYHQLRYYLRKYPLA